MSITLQTTPASSLSAQFMGFAGGERHVQLTGLPNEALRSVVIRAQILDSNTLMDLLLLEDALLRHMPDLAIDLELPYLPYARQDRVCAAGQAFSMDVMARLLALNPKRHIAVWDAHSAVSVALTGAINVSAVDVVAASPELSQLLGEAQTVLVCPDKGAVPRCTQMQEAFHTPRMVLCQKVRDPMTGQIVRSEVLADDVQGLTAVITDDICDGGMTFIGVARALRELGVARVVLYVTHGIFSKGLAVFDGLVDEIYCSNSITHNPHAKLRVINFQYQFGA